MGLDAEDQGEDVPAAAGQVFADAVAIMARLRGVDGCPWDREQDFESIRRYTLEETYEVIDAIDRKDWKNLQEELGDLLLQVLFYAQMAAEPGYFNITDVIEGLNRKLVRRHPHVFGDQASAAAGNTSAALETSGIGAEQVLRNWEQIKIAEKGSVPDFAAKASVLDAVPRSFPALLEASKLGSKAAKSGFDWPDTDGVFAKLEEEIEELREVIPGPERNAISSEEQNRIEDELGDLLFTTVNLARHLGVDPELALRGTNQKFRRRYAAMESASISPLDRQSADQLESLWAGAKQVERSLPEPTR
ncbi:Nucleoside triphosphate pyrophosphohydrolase MazG [Acidisarcina polymorpha]|uniref:Nucleoside triphosphate pyrophosphohydrolase MazG n=1 Tax=Acidisarcina polymorpha TaxID=2211140 RepID=A0A2Z5G7N4_9BACT|nr:nucleoside triphosphate pyrophosphohydrolase [Acidisarcina polymorpha]AXC14714.1 Nucleoside triphosphate pyrophosphohydrolase MazG [Acidisarcina polymorpha]